MVLADDNFATIVAAVEEGRRIYDNIRRFVRYLLTTNSGEIWVMLLGPLLGLPLPLLPLQILWINLVTDGLPALALGLEPAERDAMRRPPRPASESILAGGLWQHAVGSGCFMAAVTLPLQAVTRAAGWPWQTMVFTTLALLQLGHALAMRSEHESAFQLGLPDQPVVGRRRGHQRRRPARSHLRPAAADGVPHRGADRRAARDRDRPLEQRVRRSSRSRSGGAAAPRRSAAGHLSRRRALHD